MDFLQSLEHNLAENTAKVVQGLAADYTHILTPSSNIGKNFMPRLGAMMDVAPLSDVMEVCELFCCTFYRNTLVIIMVSISPGDQ